MLPYNHSLGLHPFDHLLLLHANTVPANYAGVVMHDVVHDDLVLVCDLITLSHGIAQVFRHCCDVVQAQVQIIGLGFHQLGEC